MNQIELLNAKSISGDISLPGSKSITNRILLLAALGSGSISISGSLESDDTNYMIEALKKLGVNINKSGAQIEILGTHGKFTNNNAELFLGNAGTAYRPLTAALSLMNGNYLLDGVGRMQERPIKDLVDALTQLGANIEYKKNVGFPPLKISPPNLADSPKIKIKGNVSSQYLTALLMACPLLKRPVVIDLDGELISKPYIDMTLKLLHKFGVNYINNNWKSFALKEAQNISNPSTINIEGDASSASYFFAAAAIAGDINVIGIDDQSIQGDIEFVKVLEKMGAKVKFNNNSISVSKGKALIGQEVDCKMIPDAAMTLATLSFFCKGSTTLKNIGSWRVKETDRIQAMHNELTKLGAKVTSSSDAITITPPNSINDGIDIDTYDDHRMAMCFALLSFTDKKIFINNPDCVSKTYPNFFKDFNGLLNV
jgi:3-phosphoshikimate 1-carboxyvinyltransferase